MFDWSLSKVLHESQQISIRVLNEKLRLTVLMLAFTIPNGVNFLKYFIVGTNCFVVQQANIFYLNLKVDAPTKGSL